MRKTFVLRYLFFLYLFCETGGILSVTYRYGIGFMHLRIAIIDSYMLKRRAYC